jgi:hypothetical protein
MMDERAKRRPDFCGGAEVRMADGQVWTVAKPRARFTVGDGDEGMRPVLNYPGADGYNDLYLRMKDAQKRLREAPEADEDGAETGEQARLFNEVVSAQLRMFEMLVLRNYDLTREEVRQLLQFSFDEEDVEAEGLYQTLREVAEGRGPKPPGGTSA